VVQQRNNYIPYGDLIPTVARSIQALYYS
jgi:hypothetical protein